MWVGNKAGAIADLQNDTIVSNVFMRRIMSRPGKLFPDI
ncbi:hypothetical protein MGWOODY_Hyp1158 [hydrothermal vent metagenome]|uniref:Uncharacterized protein n=1 Tax=hydrothermal vent metagenome TaxID=652676 RepID=A0A160TZ07_9ZZZZ